MEIKKEEIEHIANLSMLNLSEDELNGYQKDMEQIVEFANTINEIDTSKVPETAFVSELYNVFRKDEIKESLDRELILSNSPNGKGETFSVPTDN